MFVMYTSACMWVCTYTLHSIKIWGNLYVTFCVQTFDMYSMSDEWIAELEITI